MLTDSERTRLRTCLRRVVGGRDHLTDCQTGQIAAETNLPLRKVECFALAEGVIPERYDRNIGTLGLEGQCKLLSSCVTVVGLGGLGGHVIETLARLGVGRIIGVDGDVFVESNLNRQLLSNVENFGQSKAEQAGLHVRRVNPAVEFVGYSAPFQSVADRIFSDSSLVFDCLDSISERRVLAERCASAGVALVHGAIAGWCGQVAVCPAGGDVLDRLYAGGKRGVETHVGNLPFTAAVAANLMVAKAVPLLLGQPVPTCLEVQFFDLLDGDWETIKL